MTVPSDPNGGSARRSDATQPIDRDALQRLIADLGSRDSGSDSPPEAHELGAFVIHEEIGRGSMGAVYRATHRQLGRDVALKILPHGAAASAAARGRFLREARALARVDHPHVVRVHDVLEAGGTLAIAMELVDGVPLGQLIADLRTAKQEHGRPPDLDAVAGALGTEANRLDADHYFAWTARIGRDLGRALQAVHDQGLVHRDVKPSNVLFDRSGSVHLSDFGIVRDDDASISRTGAFVGTAQYAAPEQIRGDRQIDARADVYGLGATLYEVLSLRAPALGSMTAILEAVERQRVSPLRRLVPGIPRDLATIVERAIDSDPRRRYPTAAAFSDDLQAFLDDRPVSARRPSAPARLARWTRREPARATAMSALVALAIVAGYTLTIWGPAELAHRAETAAEVRRLLSRGFLYLAEPSLSGRALEQFEQAYSVDPDSPEALVGLVLGKAERYRRDEALALLESRGDLIRRHPVLQRLAEAELLLYRIDPDDDLVSRPAGMADVLTVSPLEAFVLGMANALRAAGAERKDLWHRAAHYLLIANQLDPTPSELYHTELAQAYAQAGDTAALDIQRLALEHNFPDSWTAAYSLARSYSSVDPEMALEKCQLARDLGGDPLLCDLREAKIHRTAGHADEALATIDRLLARIPDEPYALGIGYLCRRQSAQHSGDAVEWFDRAAASLSSRIDSMAPAAEDPDIVWHLSLLELCKHRLKDEFDAWLSAMARRDTTAADAAAAKVDELASQALRVARDAVARAPGSFSSHAAIGFWLSETRRLRAFEIRRLLRDASRGGGVPSEQATQARREYVANLEEARRHFERANQLAPFQIWVARDYARFLLLHEDDFEAALEPIRQQVVLDPETWEHRQVLGSTLIQAGRLDQGIEQLTGVLAEVSPRERHLPLAFRGGAFLEQGRFEEAEADLRASLKALESRTGLARTRSRVSTALARTLLRASDDPERFDAVYDRIREALRARRDNAEAVATLAELRYAQGKVDEADRIARDAGKLLERQARMEISPRARVRILDLADATARHLRTCRDRAEARR